MFSCASSQQKGKRRGASPRMDVPLAFPSSITLAGGDVAPPQPPAPLPPPSLAHQVAATLASLLFTDHAVSHLRAFALATGSTPSSCPSPKPPLLLLHLITHLLPSLQLVIWSVTSPHVLQHFSQPRSNLWVQEPLLPCSHHFPRAQCSVWHTAGAQ